jgi:hypothetical protein
LLIKNVRPFKIGIAGEQGVVEVKEGEVHAVMFRCIDEQFAQQRQGDGAFVFKRVLVEGDDEAGQRAHVARGVAHQVVDGFRR